MPYASNNGVRLYYEVEGNGPPLVLHPGVMMRLQSWRHEDVGYAQALRGAYRLILLDPRGHGRSDRPHDAAAYHIETRVRDVTAVLDAVGVERAHYWGYSLGASLGVALGISAPSRLHSLILGAAHPYRSDRDRAGDRQWAADLRQGTMADWVARMEAHMGAARPPAFRDGLLDNDALAQAALREARAVDPDLGDQVAGITTPTLIYAGDRDEAYARAQQAAAAIPGATFVALPGLDHGESFLAARAVLPHVLAFLAKVG